MGIRLVPGSAIVTGASSGNGKAVNTRHLAVDWRVMVVHVDSSGPGGAREGLWTVGAGTVVTVEANMHVPISHLAPISFGGEAP